MAALRSPPHGGGSIHGLPVGQVLGVETLVVVVAVVVGLIRARVVARSPEQAKAGVRHEIGVGLGSEATGAPVVIGMRVGDEDGVYVAHLQPRSTKTRAERPPRVRARKPCVEHGDAAVIDECVRVHVAEPGQRDRELHAQHSGPDFGDRCVR